MGPHKWIFIVVIAIIVINFEICIEWVGMVLDLSYLPTGCGYKNECDQRKITFYKSYLIINVKPPDSFFTYQKKKKKNHLIVFYF